MKNLYIDVETTSLIRKDTDWETEYLKFPRIVSIAWRMNEIQRYFILNQCGKPIPPQATNVHGITDDMCKESRYYIRPILRQFIREAEDSDFVIGHNIYFDSCIIKANVLREFGQDSEEAIKIKEILHKSKRIDIMRKAVSYNKGWLTLEKMHNKLFGCGFKAHDAQEDTKAVERCYLKLVELGVIKENQLQRI